MMGALLLAVSAAAAAAPLPPLIYAKTTPAYDVALRIAPELRRYPRLYAGFQARVMDDLVRLEARARRAHANRDLGRLQVADPPWVARVELDFVVRTPHLTSFVERGYGAFDGVHANTTAAGWIVDNSTGRRLSAAELLRADADTRPLNRALNRRADDLRTSRVGVDYHVTPSSWTHGDLHATRGGVVGEEADAAEPVAAALTASTEAARAGGLQFLYSPDDIGSFAEGGYRVVLSWASFAADLKPQYRSDFNGVPAGDLGGDPVRGFPTDLPP